MPFCHNSRCSVVHRLLFLLLVALFAIQLIRRWRNRKKKKRSSCPQRRPFRKDGTKPARVDNFKYFAFKDRDGTFENLNLVDRSIVLVQQSISVVLSRLLRPDGTSFVPSEFANYSTSYWLRTHVAHQVALSALMSGMLNHSALRVPEPSLHRRPRQPAHLTVSIVQAVDSRRDQDQTLDVLIPLTLIIETSEICNYTVYNPPALFNVS